MLGYVCFTHALDANKSQSTAETLNGTTHMTKKVFCAPTFCAQPFVIRSDHNRVFQLEFEVVALIIGRLAF